MSRYSVLHDDNPQENITSFNFYNPFALVHADYHGCLPENDDAADYIRNNRIRAIKVS